MKKDIEGVVNGKRRYILYFEVEEYEQMHGLHEMLGEDRSFQQFLKRGLAEFRDGILAKQKALREAKSRVDLGGW